MIVLRIITQGDRIRALFENAAGEVAVIAPFIKVDALRSLLEVIPSNTRIRCVTRWLPREVAAGVSDPEILYALEKRGNFSLCLVDRLHAKIYIAGDRCLSGSSNVTFAGLGDGADYKNIEVLVETTVDDPGIVATLDEICQAQRLATSAMAQSVRRFADSLPATGAVGHEMAWFPKSRRPEHAYRFYTEPGISNVRAADRILLADLASANLQPGLGEGEFRLAIRSLLSTIPIAETLLNATDDVTLTRSDALVHLATIAADEFTSNDLWLAFVNWMAYFFSDQVIRQEIAEIALRRGQLLDS